MTGFFSPRGPARLSWLLIIKLCAEEGCQQLLLKMKCLSLEPCFPIPPPLLITSVSWEIHLPLLTSVSSFIAGG